MSVSASWYRGPVAVLLAFTVLPALAGNVFFMKDTALSNMTDGDLEILRATARELLDGADDGAAADWNNPETGASGELAVLSTSAAGDSVCRRLKMSNSAGGQSGRGEFDFCRQPDGTWKIPPAPPGGSTQ